MNRATARSVAWHGSPTAFSLVELEKVAGAWTPLDTTSRIQTVGVAVSDSSAQLSPDGCWIVFTRLDNSTGAHDILISIRGVDGAFEIPQKLATNALVPSNNHRDPWLSPDGNTLYFDDGSGGKMYSAPRMP